MEKSGKIHTTEHIFRTKMDLKLQGRTQPAFKTVMETKILENISISQNQEFSDNTSFAQTISLVPSQERISAIDGFNNYISNINNFFFN